MTVSPLRGPFVASFDDFYRLYYVRVLVLIRRHFPSCDAEEIAQETLTRCLARFEDLDPQRDPWPWVSSVARNAAIDSMRRNSKTVSTDALPDAPRGNEDATYEAVVLLDRRRALRTALRRLRPTDRQLIEDRELEGMGYAEMAALRDITPNSLRQQLHRARLRLATELRRVGAAVGVVPAAMQFRFERWSRRFNDVSAAAGPAGASALSAVAVAGIAGVASFAAILAGPGATSPAGSFAGSEPVPAVERRVPVTRVAATTPVSRPARRQAVTPASVPAVVPPDPPTINIQRNGDPLKDEPHSATAKIILPNGEEIDLGGYSMGGMPLNDTACWALEALECPDEQDQPG